MFLLGLLEGEMGRPDNPGIQQMARIDRAIVWTCRHGHDHRDNVCEVNAVVYFRVIDPESR
jgi:hypothetical protein